MSSLAVVIVNWNTPQLTLDTLRTLYVDIEQHGPENTTVYVVDNASSDDSVIRIREQFPQVQLIESQQNLGFGGGNNLALRTIGFGQSVPIKQLPDAVYFLNSDTLTQSKATITLFQTLLAYSDAGVVGARLTYGDGSFQHSAFAFPSLKQLAIDLWPMFQRWYDTPLNGRYSRALYEQPRPFLVDFVLGATMMVRREVIQDVGMFDEQFFMYAEEVDWQWRIRKHGWQIYCVPTAHVVHLGGQSARLVKQQSIENLWASRLLLFKKHYSLPRRWAASWMIRLGMFAKMREAKRLSSEGAISPTEREAMIAAYQTVLKMI
ncbi:MAG: glycosyltransferase family 2 protein [Phototrophicales bacterium]|nr:MAG: glycosyltransferase family 2 protein [Phototrophicales bacterium]